MGLAVSICWYRWSGCGLHHANGGTVLFTQNTGEKINIFIDKITFLITIHERIIVLEFTFEPEWMFELKFEEMNVFSLDTQHSLRAMHFGQSQLNTSEILKTLTTLCLGTSRSGTCPSRSSWTFVLCRDVGRAAGQHRTDGKQKREIISVGGVEKINIIIIRELWAKLPKY